MANPPQELSFRKCFKAFIDHEGKLSTLEVRNFLLVVATLIAAVTFQAGVNPPGGVWQDNKDHDAGTAIYASDETAFLIFLTCNTLALSSSILIIISLTWDFPFFLEVLIATVSMVMTYGASVFAVTPRKNNRKKSMFRYVLFIAAVPVVVRVVIQIYKYVMWKRSEGKRKDLG